MSIQVDIVPAFWMSQPVERGRCEISIAYVMPVTKEEAPDDLGIKRKNQPSFMSS